MNICEHLTGTALLFPEREAIRFEGTGFTYAQLNRLSISAADRLLDAGVHPGDRIAIMLPNSPAFVVWYYAALRIGAIAVSLSTRMTASEVALLILDCEAEVLVTVEATLANMRPELPDCVAKTFTTSDLADRCNDQPLEQACEINSNGAANSNWVDREPHDPALILYTSGTTGFAKGATLSHQNVRSNVHAFNHLCNMRPEDRILLAVPLFHCFGQNALLNSAFNVGATLVLQRRFDLSESKRLIADHQVTQLYGVPMMFQLFLDHCNLPDLASVSYCFSAAATLPIRICQQWQQKFGMPIYEGYGLTETSPFASYNHRLRFVPGSIGAPIDSVEMKIVDTETGETCAPGQLGEIAIRGPNVMLGYWNREQETIAAIRDGWFHSGDIGRIDEQGYFYIVDRVKDMIAIGGLKVYPAEVERVLLEHPAISQAAVVGIPDQVLGEQVVAFVVLEDGASIEDGNRPVAIREHVKKDLASYKVPRTIVPVSELPRNPSGKVLKTKLRQYELSSRDTSSVLDQSRNSPEPDALQINLPAHHRRREPTLRKQLRSTHRAGRSRVVNQFLQHLVQTVAQSEKLPEPDARFLDAGLDSLTLVEMTAQLQIEMGVKQTLPATLVFDHPRICDLGDYLVELLTEDESTMSPTTSQSSLHQQIESMSEAEVMTELLKEIES